MKHCEMTSYLPDLGANMPRKKLWAFETVGVGENKRIHFLIDSIL